MTAKPDRIDTAQRMANWALGLGVYGVFSGLVLLTLADGATLGFIGWPLVFLGPFAAVAAVVLGYKAQSRKRGGSEETDGRAEGAVILGYQWWLLVCAFGDPHGSGMIFFIPVVLLIEVPRLMLRFAARGLWREFTVAGCFLAGLTSLVLCPGIPFLYVGGVGILELGLFAGWVLFNHGPGMNTPRRILLALLFYLLATANVIWAWEVLSRS